MSMEVEDFKIMRKTKTKREVGDGDMFDGEDEVYFSGKRE